MNLAKFPRRHYVTTATPIEFLPNLTKALGDKVNIYIKRDDMLPGTSGGNKTRKLDFCMADALAKGADTIITCGAVQSNHCRLTLAWANVEKMDCHFILEERVAHSYKSEASGNNFLFKLLGIKSIKVVPGGSNMLAEMEALAETLKAQGKKPYIISGGASNKIGSLGYVACAEEIMQQIFQQQLRIDQIIVPSGSAGTHAGMAVGLFANNMQIPLLGIGVNRPKAKQEEAVLKLAQETIDYIGLNLTIPATVIQANTDYVGQGYSLPTDSMIEAVTLLARTESILLDPVYSGKVMAGMIDLVRKGYFPEGSNIMFLHTGGSPALYAYENIFEQ